MRRFARLLLPALVLLSPVAADEPVVRFVEFDATVNPVTVHRIVKTIDEAESAGDDLVLIRLDTPGGLVPSMESIVKRMLAAEVPVVVWVGPAGAKAASAGFFILLAADVAAMAPGTRTGAAATVFGTGEGSEHNVLLKKANEDSAALLRSIADRRGRNVEAAESTVFSAKAFEETVALEKGLIDLVAGDVDELLSELDGREVLRFDGTTVLLRTANAKLVTTEFSIKHGFMEVLSIPLVALLLLFVGLIGLYVEFTHPGLIFPGVVGALCLLLFLLAAQVLPVSYIGALLILLAVVMFLLEIKVASFGLLTLGGTISLVIGSVMLIDGPIPEMSVPWTVVVPIALMIAGLFALVVRLVVKARGARVGTGVEGLAGEIGKVTQSLSPEGKVFVHGEIWDASTAGESIPEGRRVRVVRVDDMRLTVEPADGLPAPRS